MGKRQISDLQPSELVITLMISEVATIPLENNNQSLLSGVIPVLILISLEIVVSVIMMKNVTFRKIICGGPVLIIKDGKILQSQMRRLRITTEDLCVQLRQQGIFSLEDVQYCIIETNGSVSVLEKPEKRQPSASDFKISIPDNKIETVVINDGKILQHSLELCQKDLSDIYDILKSENKSLSDIFIMTLDASSNYNIIMKENKK
ncbi:MAG: DUF421 domain-containing protein [Ruminococcus sp.]|nr:DUF421 domain-containing protein [Ruminococcus sp.]